MMEILGLLVINWDQTGIQYVSVSQWTMEREGIKQTEITVFGVTMDGAFLSPQSVYAGKIPKCLPKVDFSGDWDITFMENHWCNEAVMIDYVNKILFRTSHIRGSNLVWVHLSFIGDF